jgi:hypothetical protein
VVFFCIKKENRKRALVPHACNLSYSGGRDQEDRGLTLVQENSSRDPIFKKNSTQQRAGGVPQVVALLWLA